MNSNFVKKARKPLGVALSFSLALSLSPHVLSSAWAAEDEAAPVPPEAEQPASDGIQTEGGIQFAINTSGTATVVGLEDSNIENLIIPSTLGDVPVTAIDKQAFSSNSDLKTVVLPEGLKTIGDQSFNYCRNLVSVTLPNSLESIGEWAFYSCGSLSSITLPNSLDYIGPLAFARCNSLTSIALPEGFETLQGQTFQGCASLAQVTLPQSLRNIGPYDFQGCTSLASIDLPNSLEEIGWEAFGDCTSLKNIAIPASVTKIGRDAFADLGWSSVITVQTRALYNLISASPSTYYSTDRTKFSYEEGYPVAVSSISVAPSNATMEVYDTKTLSASVSPAAAAGDLDIQWSSSNTSVAKVNDSGMVTAVGPGTATITASAEGKSDSCTVVVANDSGYTVELFDDPIELTVNRENATSITWRVANESIAKVSNVSQSVISIGGYNRVVSSAAIAPQSTGTTFVQAFDGAQLIYQVELTVLPGEAQDISDVIVAGMEDTYILSDGAVKPRPTVRFNGKTLVEGTDYTLSYVNNDRAGTAEVVISGIGRYTGTRKVEFEIIEIETPDVEFPDVSSTDWFAEYLDYVVSHGIVTGVIAPDGTAYFQPYENISRGQVATMLYRAANPGSTDTTDPNDYASSSSFSDVPSNVYYTAAINWCKDQGIITGYDLGNGVFEFSPDNPVSRAELAAMMRRFASTKTDVDTIDTPEFESMPDRNEVPDWAYESMAWCFNEGVITGKVEETGSYLCPNDLATRAEASKVFTVVLRDILAM